MGVLSNQTEKDYKDLVKKEKETLMNELDLSEERVF